MAKILDKIFGGHGAPLRVNARLRHQADGGGIEWQEVAVLDCPGFVECESDMISVSCYPDIVLWGDALGFGTPGNILC